MVEHNHHTFKGGGSLRKHLVQCLYFSKWEIVFLPLPPPSKRTEYEELPILREINEPAKATAKIQVSYL